MPGLMDWYNHPDTQGALSLAGALLEAGGPSPYPNSIATALGRAFQTFSKNQQQQELVNLERQKTQLTAAQVQAALREQQMKAWALGYAPTPIPGAEGPTDSGSMPSLSGGSPGPMQGGIPGQLPPSAMNPVQFPAYGMMGPGSGPGPSAGGPTMPPGVPAATGAVQPPMQGPFANLPPDTQQAVRANIAFPGTGSIVAQGMGPVVGREGGIFRRDAQGNLVLDPGWIAGEEARIRLQKRIESENKVAKVTLPWMAPGTSQEMTEAQHLDLLNPENVSGQLSPQDQALIHDDMRRSGVASAPVKMEYPGGVVVGNVKAPGVTPGMPTGTPTFSDSRAQTAGREDAQAENTAFEEAKSATQGKSDITALRQYAGNFSPNALAPFKQKMGEWLIGLGAPAQAVNDKLGSIGDMQAAQKVAFSIATQLTRQVSTRPAAVEWLQILNKATPTISMTPEGFNNILNKLDADYTRRIGLADQWTSKPRDYQGTFREFEQNYNRDYLRRLETNPGAATSPPSAGPAQTFSDLPAANTGNKGQRIYDRVEKKYLRSNGMKWVPE